MSKNNNYEGIQLGPNHKHQLKKEFNCTRQTVHMAINYLTNSELAQEIRKRSKELLVEEADNIIISRQQR